MLIFNESFHLVTINLLLLILLSCVYEMEEFDLTNIGSLIREVLQSTTFKTIEFYFAIRSNKDLKIVSFTV